MNNTIMDKKDFLYCRLGSDYETSESAWETYNWFLNHCYLDTIDLTEENLENEIIYNLSDIQQIIEDIISEYFENGSLFEDVLVDNDFYEDLEYYYFISLDSPNIIKIDFSELFRLTIDFAESNDIEVPKVKENGKVLLSILDKLNCKYPFKFTHP
jgi:hypothetical protein